MIETIPSSDLVSHVLNASLHLHSPERFLKSIAFEELPPERREILRSGESRKVTFSKLSDSSLDLSPEEMGLKPSCLFKS